MAAGGFHVARHGIKVKNTFIEEDSEDMMYTGLDDDVVCFAKRQVSEPAPSIGRLADTAVHQNTLTFINNLLPKVPECPHSQASTQESLPEVHSPESSEPEREADCSDSMRQRQQQVGYPVPGGAAAPVPSGAPSQPMVEAMLKQQLAAMVSSGNQTIPPAWANVQTIMIRNLPNKVDQCTLRSMIDKAGFANTYDFVYLPIDPDTDANRGYAFVNFVTSHFAFLSKLVFEGRKFCQTNSRKIVSVVPATLQGFEANYAHYSKTRITQGDPAARPLFLREPTAKTQRGGRNKTQSLIDLASKQLRKQQQQLQEHRGREFRPDMLPVASSPSTGRSAMPGTQGNPGKQAVASFCPYCGGSVKSDYKFCQFCGASVSFDEE